MRESKIMARGLTFIVRSSRLVTGWRDRRGVSAVEFALIAPLLIGMMICIADFGLGYYSDTQLASAAQASATYAAQNGYDAAAMTTVAQAATKLASVGVTPTQFCGCPSPGGVTSTSCGATCGDGLRAGTFAQVTATTDYATLVSYPGVPNVFHLSEKATARLQ